MYQSNIYEYLQDREVSASKPLLILCKDDKEAQSVSDVASLSGYRVFLLPDIRVSVGEDLRAYQDEIYTLFATLSDYYHSDGSRILVAPLRTMLLPLPKRELFGNKKIEFGDTIALQVFKEELYCWGYHFVDIASQRGEVSFRGDIIDIFPINAEFPCRISLFDEEVESIRHYDENSQKSFIEELEEFSIIPTYLALNAEQFEEWKGRSERSRYDTFVRDIDSLGLWHLDELAEEYFPLFEAVSSSDLSRDIEEIYSLQEPFVAQESIPAAVIPSARHYRDLEVVKPNALLESHKEKKITIIARNESIVRGSELSSFEGLEFVYQEGVVNILGPDHLILSLNKPIKKKRVKKASIILDELKPGDYVVHENHGVGLFRAIEKREILGATREFVVINYQNEDSLLVPVENLEVIDRYVAEGGVLPALDRLGKASFKRLKGKVREKLFAIASQIINLSAQRHLQKGIVLKTDMEEHTLFMAEAGFVHTEDQERAIREMLEDMGSGRMMDRLLSADVGFGKTEVAMNGIFIAAQNGYQSMMVAPTTLLSAQHYKSLRERFEKYDIKIAKLDRFSSPKAKREVLKGLEEGTIDMV
ncbi:MAG: CarD family transcriptional regulator, partial [Campylobacterota bacterium]|nr:CarD family transcriptional regulator [Campylobacterota bacterium]